jgi:hypothetical protein
MEDFSEYDILLVRRLFGLSVKSSWAELSRNQRMDLRDIVAAVYGFSDRGNTQAAHNYS